MLRLIFLVGLAVLGFYFFRWLYHQPRGMQWRALAGLLAVGLLLLVVTGRAHWLAAAFAAVFAFLRLLLPLLSQLPLLKRIFGGVNTAYGATGSDKEQTSTVQSRYIAMTLNHESGEITGEVLDGKFKGRTLDDLTLDESLELLQMCQDDEESIALLQAFLDRKYEDAWREHSTKNDQQQGNGDTGESPDSMSREEATQILGLSPDASEQEIKKVHRRLMQILHPDRGGSAYFAAKLNQARDTLLGE